MLKLIQLEWSKIYPYKTGRIMIIAYFLLLIGAAFGMANIKIGIGGSQNISLQSLGIYNFPLAWQFIGWFAAFLKLFLAIIIITNITNEYAFKTIKQNLIDGLSKQQFIASKLLTNVCLSILSTIAVGGIIIAMTSILGDSSNPFYHGVQYLGAYFLNLITFFSICLFVSVLVRKSAFSLGLIIIWYVLETVISGVEVLIRTQLLDQKLMDLENGFMLSNCLPLSTVSSLISFPEADFKNYLTGATKQAFLTTPIQWEFVLLSIIYALLFSYLSYRLVVKKDL